MNKIVSVLYAIVITTMIPLYSFAWNNEGHAMISEIAFSLLNADIKEKVQKALGPMSIEEAGCWMNNIRNNRRYDYMQTWHYLNIEKGNKYVPNNEHNIINALSKSLEQLEQKNKLTDSAIKMNLLIVFHLVGDMAMPLNVGYGVDKGGNLIRVKYLGHQSNLHHVWEDDIISSENIQTEDCLACYKTMEKFEVAQYKKINLEDWLMESRSLLDTVYNFPWDNIIDQPYTDKSKKIIEKQLVIAGVRLAAVLEEIFKS